ncbi:helix-turn-helix transcriptional regulator [Nonomuraea sp. bgisy101]|uniref:helix-turn-helix transcriptional regulator n=1 Tax=Nonomuraea sp. bgisy101 TaxID=3413784 RepID=UPI003D75B35E
MTGDDAAACELAAARVHTCREQGQIGALPHALQLLTQAQILRGRYAEAARSGAEAWQIAHDTGQAGRLRHLQGVLARLAALRGEDETCLRLAGEVARFEAWASASGQPWAAAVAHRCRALLAPRGEAEPHYRAALEWHAREGRPFEQARTELLYGEWLRRERRRADAGARLRAAMRRFAALGAAPWAERARTELAATGSRADLPELGAEVRPLDALTPQELQVVRLAATGATNRQIGAQLFLSPRTVGFHLYKVFPKLGISSRAELPGIDLGRQD